MAKSGYTKFGVGLDESEKREHIKQAAKRIFGRLGYRKASVQEILTEAGISRRTFYAYFKSKEDVLIQLLDEFFSQIQRVRDLEKPDKLDNLDELRAQLARLASDLVSVILENREVVAVTFEGLVTDDKALSPRSEAILSTFTTFIREYIETSIEKGFVDVSIDPVASSQILMGIYLEVIRKVIVKNDPLPIYHWAKEILALLDRGFLKKPERL